LTGAVFFSAEFSLPWEVSTPAAKAMAATAGVGAEHLVLYHLVTRAIEKHRVDLAGHTPWRKSHAELLANEGEMMIGQRAVCPNKMNANPDARRRTVRGSGTGSMSDSALIT